MNLADENKSTPLPAPSRFSIRMGSAVLFILGFLLALFCSSQDNRTGLTVEFVEYADTARAIANGHGFSSRTINPSMLAVAEEQAIVIQDGHWPQSYRHPGFAYILAVFFLVFGPTDTALAIALSFFFALWIAMSHLVLSRFFGPKTSLAASLLLMMNPVFLRFYVPGGYAAFLFGAAVLFFLYRASEILHLQKPPPLMTCALLGLLAALAWHLRFNFILIFVLFLFIGCFSLPRTLESLKSLGVCLGVFFLATSPFRIWQQLVWGEGKDPATIWNLLDGLTGARPWMQYTAWGSSDLWRVDRIAYLLTNKFPYFVEQTIRHFPSFLQYLPLVPLFVASLFFLKKTARHRTFFLFSLFSFLMMTFVLSFFRHEIWIVDDPTDLRILSSRYYIWFAPVFVAASLEGLRFLLSGRSLFSAQVISFALVLIQIFLWLPLYASSARLYADIQEPLIEKAIFQEIKNAQESNRLEKDLMLLSNIPSHISWYAHQSTLGVPDDPGEVGKIAKDYQLAGLHFTRSSIGEPHNTPQWVQLFQDHKAMTSFLARQRLELVFTDGKDWLFLPSPAAKVEIPPPTRKHIGTTPSNDASVNTAQPAQPDHVNPSELKPPENNPPASGSKPQ